SLVRENGGAVIRCANPRCAAKHREAVIHFAGKHGFDIEGLGEKVVHALIDAELIADAADIFTLSKEDFLELPLFKGKRAENLKTAVEEAKNVPISRFLFALGIRHVGEGTSQDLAKFIIGHLQKDRDLRPIELFRFMQGISPDEINAIEGFGDVVARSVHEYFHDRQAERFVEKMDKAGVRVFSDITQKKTALSGKKIVVTGTLSQMGREEAKDAVKRAGGVVQSDVSAKTDYVVCGENPGSKLQRAQELGVKVLDEKGFLEMLRE
ncbi:NAD-dependent DNA ligase LigA, partial [Candidatus Peregrinibacteria bacterium]|nr:NAD-dependent DNA ligase LigA [Candidatus Peregrinibacteria bacterium]